MNLIIKTFTGLLLTSSILSLSAKDIPAQLPVTNGRPGDSTKPVEVYIMSGQSNMVGMATLSGARNSYSGNFYCSDPEMPAGPLAIWQVGNFKTAPLAVLHPRKARLTASD